MKGLSLARKMVAHLFDVNELGSKLLNLELPRRKSFLHTELQGIGIRVPLPELLHEEAHLCDQADDRNEGWNRGRSMKRRCQSWGVAYTHARMCACMR